MVQPADGPALRPMRLEDIVRVLEWRNLPEVGRYMYSDHHISEVEHARWFGSAMESSSRRYWIIELDGRPVGLANLYDISELHGRAYWAFYLADPSIRGRGVGSFVERSILRYAFKELGLNKLCCEVLGSNQQVIKMHERFGFRVDGTLRRHIRKSAGFEDVVTMSLLSEDAKSPVQA